MTEQEFIVKNLQKMIDRRYEMLKACYNVDQQRKHIAIIEEFETMLANEKEAVEA
jgi:hypothetical protein